MDAVDKLRQLRDEIEERLKANPDYVALQGIKRAIRDVMLLSNDTASRVTRVNARLRAALAHQAADKPSLDSGVSQADAAFAVLNEEIEPVAISDLVPLVRGKGATVGGANPELNLSSSLSRDGRFESIRHKGRPCWGIKGKNYPHSLLAQAFMHSQSTLGEEPAKAPPADDNDL